MKVRTQKARSVEALRVSGYNTPSFALVQTEAEIDLVTGAYPKFARPCPVTPRHGFVDSRMVYTIKEARATFREAISVDPQAEMLLMAPINAECNAVLTSGSVTFGPGHDGATQGKDAATFPLSGAEFPDVVKERAGITESAYAEAVYSKGIPYAFFTQLRNGPKVEALADRIPADVTVANVIALDPNAFPDALQWESDCKAMPLDTAIYHPQGSQTSHYAVHAALRGLACFTSRKPEIGEVLKANIGTIPPYDLAAFRRGVLQGITETVLTSECERATRIGLLACHHALVLRNAPGAWLFGYGAALLVRLGITASCGESRYTKHIFKGMERNAIYKEMLYAPLDALKKGTTIYRLFMEQKQGGGVGGKPWGSCTKATLDVDYLMRRAFHEGTEERFKDLIAAIHNLVNQAHNNGWYLNKFCSTSHFDSHANGEVREVLDTARMAYVALKRPKPLPNAEALATAWVSKRKARLEREGKAFREAARIAAEKAKIEAEEAEAKAAALKLEMLKFKIQVKAQLTKQGTVLHVQKGIGGNYITANVLITAESKAAILEMINALPLGPSLSGSGQVYRVIVVDGVGTIPAEIANLPLSYGDVNALKM